VSALVGDGEFPDGHGAGVGQGVDRVGTFVGILAGRRLEADDGEVFMCPERTSLRPVGAAGDT